MVTLKSNLMKKKTVFLCGPMRGVNRKLSLEWRKKATKILSPKFSVVHAMRGRELKEVFSDYRAAVVRDISDIKNSDLLLVNDTFKDVEIKKAGIKKKERNTI